MGFRKLAGTKDGAFGLAFRKVVQALNFNLNYYTPVEATVQEVDNLKHKDVLRNLGTALKVTSGILKVVQEIVGFPFPDIAAILDTISDVATKSENILNNVQHVVDFGKGQAKNSNITVDCSTKHLSVWMAPHSAT